MPTFELEINGKPFEVDAPDMNTAVLRIKGLQPTQQEDQIPLPQSRPSQYEIDARSEYNALKDKGVPVEPGLTRLAAHGMTLGASDEALAALQTPIEMFRAGSFDPRVGYNRAKAFQDVQLDEARNANPIAGPIAEVGGGLFTGAGLAKQGVSLIPKGAGLARRLLGYGAEGAGYGAVSGFNEGSGLEDRTEKALLGGGIGAVGGVVLPATGAAIAGAGGKVVSNIRAMTNPQGAALSQVARAADESGRPLTEIVREVKDAAASGQPEYTLADALGNPGQRLMSTIARSPGEGRTMVVDALETRQAGQGDRLTQALARGLQAPVTAKQAEAGIENARRAAGDAIYPTLRDTAEPVNTRGVIAKIDETLAPGMNQAMKPTAIEAELIGIRNRLVDAEGNVRSDFPSLQRIYEELGDNIEAAYRAGANNRARILRGVKNELNDAMENASAGFKQANAEQARFYRQGEAIGEGQTAAQRGRREDVLADYNARPGNEQGPFRVGYADKLIENLQRKAPGVNKARDLQTRMPVLENIAQGPELAQNVAREQRMFETLNQAIGGSRTADNLADMNAMKFDPGIIMALLGGNFAKAGKGFAQTIGNIWDGASTPGMRKELANYLLQGGNNVTVSKDLEKTLSRLQQRGLFAEALARGILSGSPQYTTRK